MHTPALRILYVEDNPADVQLLRDLLREVPGHGLEITNRETLREVRESTGQEYDAVLMDLGLPDSMGLDTYRAVSSLFPELPVIIFTVSDMEDLAEEAMRAGAQDYLVKGQLTGHLVVRSIRYAIERMALYRGLARANEQLEKRVAERTRAAEEKAACLEEEVAHRKQVEERLQSAYRLADIRNKVASVFLTVQGDEVFQAILRVLLDATGSTFGIFAYLDENGDMVAPSLTAEIWEKCQVPGKSIRFPHETWSGSIWARAIREKRLMVKNGPGDSPEGHVPIRCAMAAPIVYFDKVIGIVMLANRPGEFGAVEMDTMEGVCEHIAPILHAWLEQGRTEARRKQAALSLRESEELFRRLFEDHAAVKFIIDPDTGIILDANRAAEDFYGWPRERLRRMKIEDINTLPPEEVRVQIEKVRSGEGVYFEFRHRKADGSVCDVAVFSSKFTSKGKEILHSIVHDISKRKQAENALRRRLEMEQILAGVSSQLVGMRFDEVEGSLPELLGIVAEAIHAEAGRVCSFEGGGENCLAFWSANGMVKVDDLCPGRQGGLLAWIMPRLNVFESVVIRSIADLAGATENVREALAQTGIQSLLAVPMAKGEDLIGCLAFMTTTAPRDWSSDDVSMIETVGNILANGLESARLERTLRYNERRYLDLIENLSEGLWVVDTDKKTVFINRSMARMLGYEPGEMLGTDPRDYMTEEGAHAFEHRQEERRNGESEQYSFELVHKQGHRVFVRISAAPARNEQGEIAGAMALISDLSKERLLQLQLMQAQRLEAIGQLAAGIAHEINTPAQYVDNNTQFLRGAFDDLLRLLREHEALYQAALSVPALAPAVRRVEATREEIQAEALLEDIPGAFNDAGDGLQRIALIVDSVKRFAHPSKDAMQPADLNEALRSTIVVARNEWKYVAEVATDLDPALPHVACVLSDINQVALNLIVNAAHAIASVPGRDPDAKGRITVRTRTEGDWAVIEVQDSGTGVPASIRSRIFDPFFTTKEVGKGTGQGLAIARTVVAEKHHGSITFDTEDGKGSTFIIRLPLDQPKEQPL